MLPRVPVRTAVTTVLQAIVVVVPVVFSLLSAAVTRYRIPRV